MAQGCLAEAGNRAWSEAGKMTEYEAGRSWMEATEKAG
jgi:hypothetical protein